MDDDEEPQEQRPFRWNWQAVVMLSVFVVAMAIPLAGVVWCARGYLEARQPVAVPTPARSEVNVEPLRAALENAAQTELAGEGNVKMDVEEEVSLIIPPGEMSPRAARIAELAKEAGGSSLEMTDANAPVRRLVIHVPASRRDLLRRAIDGDRVDFSAIPAGEDTQLLEVELKAP